MLNTLVRTAPGMILYLLVALTIFLSIAQGFYIALSPRFNEFSSYGATVYNIICSDF